MRCLVFFLMAALLPGAVDRIHVVERGDYGERYERVLARA